jgi:hypothetical protein
MNVTNNYKKYNKEELLTRLQAKERELRRIPKCKDINNDPEMPSVYTYYTRFGSITKALKEASLKPNRYRRYKKYSDLELQPAAGTCTKYTKEGLLNMLKEKAKYLGRIPTQDELNSDPHMPSFSTYVYRFGSFQLACKKVGLLPRKQGRSAKYTDTELLDMLRNKTKELGRPPAWHDFGKYNNMPARQVYTYRFGGIRKALKKARIL